MEGKKLRVAELFAGVGGFRLGLESCKGANGSPSFEVVWSSQFEPSTRRQHASEIYTARFGTRGHSNEDIFDVVNDESRFDTIRAAQIDLLAAGFPCQDYSVANTLANSNGLQGRKGVLWWAIHATLRKQVEDGSPVKHVLLENVDRLLKSPASCRGRDFAIILASLAGLGYVVEWRVVNAADYGFPQRRRRVFILAHHHSTPVGLCLAEAGGARCLTDRGVLAKAFRATYAEPKVFALTGDVRQVQDSFENATEQRGLFASAGVLVDGTVRTCKYTPATGEGFGPFTGSHKSLTLGDVVAKTSFVPDEFFVDDAALPQWNKYKGAKRVARVAKNGHEYQYSEGAVAFPDPLDRPARTIITGEGGVAASRTKHVIRDQNGRLRRLTPEELEELMGFPRGHTLLPGVSSARRAFLMGNALVVGLVGRIGTSLVEAIHAAGDDASPRSPLATQKPSVGSVCRGQYVAAG